MSSGQPSSRIPALVAHLSAVFAEDDSARADERISRGRRLAVAVGIGIVAGAFTWMMAMRPGAAMDFGYPHTAAQLFLQGTNPYEVMEGPPGSRAPYDQPFFYPFTMVLPLLPLAFLPVALASSLFFGVSSAALAWCITRDGWWRLHLFASAPFVLAASVGQFSPLLMLMAFSPWAGTLAALKPNIGLALFLRRPTMQAVVGSVALLVISIALLPDWPTDWLQSLRRSAGDQTHRTPLLQAGGFILLLSVVTLRTGAGRLLFALSLIPQALMFYDQLPLWLIPRTRAQSVFLTAASQAGMIWWYLSLEPGENVILASYSFVVPFLFLPALGILLWQQRGKRKT